MVKIKRRVLLSFGTPPGAYEKKKIQNKEYLSFKCVAIKAGVLNGIYVTNECIQDAVKFAEGLSAVVVHPPDGNPNSVDEKEKRQVGFFQNVEVIDFNEKDESGKDIEVKALQGDVYIDPDMASYVGFSDDLEKLKNGVAFNVSLGGFMEWLMEPGTHRGKPYKVVGVSFVTDHIAILTNEKGACSLEDGCYIGSLDPPCECPDKSKCGCSSKEVSFSQNIVNQPGYSESITMFRFLIEDLIGNDVYFHVFDVYPGFGIFETKGRYYAVKYTRDIDDQMKLSSEVIPLKHRNIFEVDNGGIATAVEGNSEQDEWLRQAGGIQKVDPAGKITLLSSGQSINDKPKEETMEVKKVDFDSAMEKVMGKINELGDGMKKISDYQEKQEAEKKKVLFSKVLSNPRNTLSESTLERMDASALESLSADLDALTKKTKSGSNRKAAFQLVSNAPDDDDFIPDEEYGEGN